MLQRREVSTAHCTTEGRGSGRSASAIVSGQQCRRPCHLVRYHPACACGQLSSARVRARVHVVEVRPRRTSVGTRATTAASAVRESSASEVVSSPLYFAASITCRLVGCSAVSHFRRGDA